MNIIKTTQSEIQNLQNQKGSIRVGSTIDPEQRAKQYYSQGYRGTMYYAETNNMQKKEDKLLENKGIHNVHSKSNVSESEGYVYVIMGKKLND
jgi:hypothetical protein